MPLTPHLQTLLGLFPESSAQLGRIERVAPEEVPEVYRRLLDHDQHMTVTVEAHHGCPVDVKVLDTRRDADRYSRRITLVRRRDGQVVQYGIVRLNMSLLEQPVRQAIEAQATPIGRVLIEHDVWRRVQRQQLYRMACGPELAYLFSVPEGTPTFGRTALIYCENEPAIELLEIVAPEPPLR